MRARIGNFKKYYRRSLYHFLIFLCITICIRQFFYVRFILPQKKLLLQGRDEGEGICLYGLVQGEIFKHLNFHR